MFIFRFQIFLILVGLLVIECCCDSKAVKSPPSLDLDDYIDNGKPEKKGDLSASETGYYNPYAYQGIHGLHGGGHQHQHHYPIYPHGQAYHQQHAHAYQAHHVPHHYGHAQSYFNGEYGGYGHLGSAHVSYGTDIHHGHPHLHHHG